MGDMTGSAEAVPGGSSQPAFEERMHRLEAQLETLIEAVEVLAQGLEDGPLAEPDNRNVQQAARRTHELLILTRSARPGQTQA